MSLSLPQFVHIVEVGPRDGLQNESVALSVEDRVEFIRLLAASGLTEIESGAFVSPKAVPQMASSDQVYAFLQKAPWARDLILPALVPNEKGLDSALAVGVKKISVFTAASESFTKANINATIDESFDRFAPTVKRARDLGLDVRGYVSTAFVCPYEGQVEPQKTIAVIHRLLDLGIHDISIGDTIGQATPLQVETLLSLLFAQNRIGPQSVALHFHNTYGHAIANVRASLQQGIVNFDSSAGGGGGCPYAPGASGNVATEDLVALFHSLGIQTGVDLPKLMQASRFLEAKLGRVLPSKILNP